MSSLGDLGRYIDENWHGGQIQGDFFENQGFDIEENLQNQKKESKSVWNWKHAITRELMRGKHKNEILLKYKTVIDRFDIKDEVCKFLDKNDCVLGYFIVDVSNFDDKFSYNDIPQNLRDCNLYAINAVELREVINRSLVSENDGSLDGFLNADDNINEEIYYLDECTGLPCIDCWDGEYDDEDERLNSIANLFLGKKWMSLSEKENFANIEGKLPYLISVVKRAFTPKSSSNDFFEDDINEYNVENYDMEADSQLAVKDVEIKNIHEQKINDIGDTSMPTKLNIENEFKKSDYCDDVDYDKQLEYETIDNNQEMKMIEIETDIPDYGFFSDNMTELTNKDYKDDVTFDNLSELVIDDIDEMPEDEFDYADLSQGDIDIDEMFENELDKNEINIEKVQEQVKISNKYDWSW